jgi:methanogenic corrinoid protein MtbC1
MYKDYAPHPNEELVVTDTVHIDTAGLQAIPPESAGWFAADMELMIVQVNRELAHSPDLPQLIGQNPLQMVEMFQRHFAPFMLTVFRLNSRDLLVRTLPWFYRTYHSRGFSYDFFPCLLRTWKKVLKSNADGDVTIREILSVYEWILDHHAEIVELSCNSTSLCFTLPNETDGMQQVFTALLLNGDHGGCLKLVEQSITSAEELRYFYEHVVRHSLYTVGMLWERNEITVAEEHQATAIVGRVTSYLYGRFVGTPQTKGTAIVTAAPNEFHEVGARMVADILELDGWDVTYLGANFPHDGLVELIRRQQPFLLALSVATPFNLEKARELIATIRRNPEFAALKILIGGLAFSSVPDLWHEFGADGYASDLEDLVARCAAWWQEGKEKT